ncbi:MAG TPA: methyltransferase [Polyangiaceae bacterium]|nr:methyltransferase [Polyangiaceae bacterium]
MVTSETPLALSSDSLLGGSVRFRQPTAGYRVNIDSLILAEFARVGRSAGVAIDLGAGVGLVSLLLEHYRAARELVLVEREPAIAAIARENLANARAKVTVHEVDVSAPSLPELLGTRADLVVSNPPFFNRTEHRAPRDEQRERARLGEVLPFLLATAELLAGPKARAAFVYPARSLTEFFDAARRARLVPKRLRFVHAFADRPARLALVELRRARPGGLVVQAPLVEWLAPQVPSPELAALSLDSTSGRK